MLPRCSLSAITTTISQDMELTWRIPTLRPKPTTTRLISRLSCLVLNLGAFLTRTLQDGDQGTEPTNEETAPPSLDVGPLHSPPPAEQPRCRESRSLDEGEIVSEENLHATVGSNEVTVLCWILLYTLRVFDRTFFVT